MSPKRIIIICITCVIFLASIFQSYRIAYKKGRLDEQITRIPFDLSIYLCLYDATDYVDFSDETVKKRVMGKPSISTLLFGQIYFFDQNRKRFEQIKKNEANNPYFRRNVSRAREITKDLNLISISEGLESLNSETDLPLPEDGF